MIKIAKFSSILLLFALHQVNAASLGNKTGKMWAPYLEWSISNPSNSGNEYDVLATATFTHSSSGKKHVTEMFFDENNSWKFRFTGTQIGNWSFVTNSSDPGLDGHTGTVTISKNTNSKITGFLTKSGNKFALQTGDNGKLEAFRLNVVQFDDSGPYKHAHITTFQTDTINKAKAYAKYAKDNGMSAIYIMLTNNWLKLGAYKYSEHNSQNPDPETFRILEKVIQTAHAEGVRVHLWAWGDEAREWTPIGINGGTNGSADKRLQRYIAARIGPLPGWSMGYGFDLNEWTNDNTRSEWANYLHDHFGWDHLLSTRGYKLPQGNNINGYSSQGGSAQLRTVDGGPKNYNEVLGDISSDNSRPSLYEERHIYEREGYSLDMNGTRKLMWWNTMAGGMGCWFGFFKQDPVFGNDPGYPNPEQLRTAAIFWDDNQRFMLNMSPSNNLTTNGYVLKSSDNKNYVFYNENTSSVQLNLSGMAGSQPAIAIDTKKAYSEINVGTLNSSNSSWQAPYKSDWAIAVGKFKGGAQNQSDNLAPASPSDLIAK